MHFGTDSLPCSVLGSSRRISPFFRFQYAGSSSWLQHWSCCGLATNARSRARPPLMPFSLSFLPRSFLGRLMAARHSLLRSAAAHNRVPSLTSCLGRLIFAFGRFTPPRPRLRL